MRPHAQSHADSLPRPVSALHSGRTPRPAPISAGISDFQDSTHIGVAPGRHHPHRVACAPVQRFPLFSTVALNNLAVAETASTRGRSASAVKPPAPPCPGEDQLGPMKFAIAGCVCRSATSAPVPDFSAPEGGHLPLRERHPPTAPPPPVRHRGAKLVISILMVALLEIHRDMTESSGNLTHHARGAKLVEQCPSGSGGKVVIIGDETQGHRATCSPGQAQNLTLTEGFTCNVHHCHVLHSTEHLGDVQ